MLTGIGANVKVLWINDRKKWGVCVMVRRKKRRKKKRTELWIGCAAAAVCLASFLVMTRSKTEAPEITEGVTRLENMERGDVAAVEETIRRRDKEELMATDEWKNRTPNEKMAYAVVLGDSRTKGLEEYEVLDDSKVLAEIGLTLTEADPYVDEAIALNPETVFLSYGLNDIGNTSGDTGIFKEQYLNVIKKLKEGLPNSKIYINTILPVQDIAVQKTPVLSQLEEYNDAIREICAQEGVGCVEIGELAQDELYEPDGEHLKSEFYPLWVNKMAEVAEI